MNTLIFYKEQTLTLLQFIAGIVERKHTLAILSNVFLQKTGNTLELTTSDLEVQVRTTLLLDENQETFEDTQLKTTVSCRKLIESLRSIDCEEIKVKVQENKLTLQGGKSLFTLQTLSAQDFPLLQRSGDFDSEFNITQKTLKNLIKQVSFAMATHDIRYYLNGMLFVLEGNTVSLVATDGNRLAYTQESLTTEVVKQEIILPRKAVLELQRLLKDDDDNVSICFSENQVLFRFNNIEFISKVIEGKFPDYQRVIPNENKNKISVNRQTLLQALQRATIIMDDKFKGVHLFFEEDTIRVVSRNADQEEANDEITVCYEGEAIQMGFNVTYLIDFLNSTDKEEVIFELSDGNSSALITIGQNTNFKYVVMPMRI